VCADRFGRSNRYAAILKQTLQKVLQKVQQKVLQKKARQAGGADREHTTGREDIPPGACECNHKLKGLPRTEQTEL
jgi:hypothetical protein